MYSGIVPGLERWRCKDTVRGSGSNERLPHSTTWNGELCVVGCASGQEIGWSEVGKVDGPRNTLNVLPTWDAHLTKGGGGRLHIYPRLLAFSTRRYCYSAKVRP